MNPALGGGGATRSVDAEEAEAWHLKCQSDSW